MYEDFFNDTVFEVSHKRIEAPEKKTYSNHMHTYCELLLFISGDADYNIDGHIYAPNPYDLLLIPKDTYHYLIPKGNTVYENYVISFSHTLATDEQYKRIFSFPLITNVAEDTVFIDFFKRLDMYRRDFSYTDFKNIAHLVIGELLIYLSYMLKSGGEIEFTTNGVIDRIINYITENIEAPLNAQIISNRLHLSPSHVQNIFSQKMHIGLKQYILQKKLYNARNDIKAGLPAIDASLKYSFTDYSGFYRAYKKTFGYSPKATK